ncbi:MAG: Hsp33 family molecular chaperone HslO [Verrucomicrobia bacterium]|nr:Hsp33 family molecular chaperone HslO [Verrucomicrobiota bacterium]
MPESSPVNPAEAGHEVRTYFVRNRNALVARASFSEMFVDYYLHLGENQLKLKPEYDTMFKRALVALTLHLASRPWNEMVAWTLHFQEPMVNLFLTGDNGDGAITGRVFDENVRDMGANIFYTDVVRGKEPMRRSTINFTGNDPLRTVESFYVQSEQRAAKIFQIAEEEYLLVAEHPDCDHAWFDALTTESAKTMDTTETLALMEKRIYRWHCGCNQKRMLEVLAPAARKDISELFETDEKIEIRCPRCGSRHTVTREAMEAFLAKP